tara:strand:+ start:1188 stop:1442 length:255 start_codon:yes stop_codon:yes gene_type:complete
MEDNYRRLIMALEDFTLDLVENQYESNKVSGPDEEVAFKVLFKEKLNELPLFVEEIQSFCEDRNIAATQVEINKQIDILIKLKE